MRRHDLVAGALLLVPLVLSCGPAEAPPPEPGDGEVRASASDGTHVVLVFLAAVDGARS